MAGILKRFAGAGADLLEEFYKKSPKQRLADASERATWDPKDGGLGLQPGNTSYERAELMFPTRVFHGGSGSAAREEIPMTGQFSSNSAGVAGTYAPFPSYSKTARDLPKFMQDAQKSELERFANEKLTYKSNIMPLRLNTDGFASVDFRGRQYNGGPSLWSREFFDKTEQPLYTLDIWDDKGSYIGAARKTSERMEDGLNKRATQFYLPQEEMPLVNKTNEVWHTDGAARAAAELLRHQYGKPDPGVIIKNVQDTGPYASNQSKWPGDSYKQSLRAQDVYVTRDPSRIRSEWAAFDPLLRNMTGVSLGASAAAVGSLLDQLPADEQKQGALYQGGAN
jgi:hypothetical protein